MSSDAGTVVTRATQAADPDLDLGAFLAADDAQRHSAASERPESKPEDSSVGRSAYRLPVNIARITSYGCEVRRSNHFGDPGGSPATLRSLADRAGATGESAFE